MLKAVVGIVVPVAVAAAVYARDIAEFVLPPPAKPTSAAAPASPMSAAARSTTSQGYERRGCARGEEVRLHADRAGHFVAQVELDGRNVEMLVDTGATRVILPAEEARRVGLIPDPSRRTRVSTANGSVDASLAVANRLRLGPICLDRVDVIVMPPGALPTALLGMNVISRLSRFEMAGTRLTLAQ